ncbi:MAG TPA: insulinase family protein [Opitutales bacterium]|jgi:zinc protease|nr:insulinase family protein [Opitutales bacterium]
MKLRASHCWLTALVAFFPVVFVPLPAADAPAVSAPAVAKPWPQDKSDIKPDPAAVYGVLPNGLRYIILPNKEPPGRVSMRLRVNAGSLMETDDQQGLAHFLEHMTFNGSKHFPPGEMVGFFERLGMGFGAGTNGNTSDQRTDYVLELPDTNDNTMRNCLQFFEDIADGLLLTQSEIDRERGVILSERRDRDNVGYRTTVAGMNFYFPDGLLPQRMPIGLESVIRGAQRDRFVDFYTKWYTPGRITVIIVGDIKPEDIASLIKEYFGPIAPRTEAPDPDLGKYGTSDFAATLHREAEAPAVSIRLMTVAPFNLGADSIERRTRELRLEAANYILSRRFERIGRQPNAPITQAGAGSDNDLDAFRLSYVEADCQPAQWQAALAVAVQELQKGLNGGFTTAEVEEARAYFLNNYEEAVKAAPTRKSAELADDLAQSLDDNEVYTSPAQDLEMAQPVLAALTPAQCQAALNEAWEQSGRRLFVSGNLDLPNPEKALTDAYENCFEAVFDLGAAVSSKPDEATAFAYASTGTPGQVVERHEVADLGITQLRFTNNVRVNLKKTDFEADKIHVLVQFGGGKLDLPADKPALALGADNLFTLGGLGKHSAEDLERLLAGKNAGADFSADGDFFQLGGVTSARDFRLELELLKAFMTDPGFRPEAYAQVRRSLPTFYNDLRQNVEAVLDNEVPHFLAGGDYRFGYPTQAQAEALTMDDVRAWLTPILKDSYLEISVVGDFDPVAMESALAATFGTLPPRAEKRADYANVLNVKFPAAAEGSVKTFTASSVIPKAEAFDCWPTCDESDIQRVRVLSVLADIFSDRLRVEVRQKHGEAYSPEAANDSSDTYPQYGYILALISADPKLAADLADEARAIADDLAKNGVTQEEFDRAITPLRKNIVEYRRQNEYWVVRVLAGSQAFPVRLERARTLAAAYDQITPAQVSVEAKNFLGAEHAVRVLVLPEAPTGSTAAAPIPATTSP